MPTGYTAAIKDGIDFKTFALQCARNFGALVMMRDEPSGTPIPERLEPSDYSKNALQKAKEHWTKLQDLTQKGWESLQDQEFGKQLAYYEKAKKEESELLEKYNEMLEKTQSWMPPTSEHNGLKSFMIDQIKQSISFDCNFYMKGDRKPKKEPLDIFISYTTDAALKDIKYHNEAWAEEQDRTDNRNKWISDLRNSLK